jgi:hypothetical protein
MRHRFIGASAGLVLAFLTFPKSPLFAQAAAGQGQRGQVAARPAPRLPDGRPNFGPPPGEKGVWLPADFARITDNDTGIDEEAVRTGQIDEAAAVAKAKPGDTSVAVSVARLPGAPERPKVSEVPFQPWAKDLYTFRQRNPFEPHTRCKPSGGVRQFVTPYGAEFVDMPELKRVFIMDIGGPHSYRIVFMDGRPHPKDLEPSYFGHSIGHWEGDTLVVDTVGFNEQFWIDREGSPHTEKLHFIEKFTRTDFNTMKYEVTIDDPGAYTRPWSSGFLLRWTPNLELFEYVCQDNNHAGELMIGNETSVNRNSEIVP